MTRHVDPAEDSKPPKWATAVQRLDELLRAAELVALVRGADSAGLLARLAEPVSTDALAETMGLRPERITVALSVLAAHGVVVDTPRGWTLTTGWAPIVLGQTPVRFDAYLGLHRIRAEQFEASLIGGEDYWQLSPEDRLIFARGISPNPIVPATVAMAGDVSGMAGVDAALRDGGRVLELGCGIGSRLCAVLRAFPAATAVGVELMPDLVDAGRRQAAALGLENRLTYVLGDATSYEPDEWFDLVGWSQFFFPEATRAGALAVAFRALRPGAWVTMPALWDGVAPEPGSVPDQELAADQLLMQMWQVPPRSTAELVDEVRATGFVEVRVDPGPLAFSVRGRRPF
ncbi:MAG TPA: methyltransferase domain-containing protein [Mycobacteriales bacterium]|nr:methyltransferase domain-containing protein [Mycobacteriales bacterium]